MYERMERIKLGALATSEAMFASDRKKNSLGLDTKSFANRARRSEQKRKSDTVVRLSRVFISNHACSIEYAHRINTECVTVQEMSSSSSSSNSSGASGLSGFQKNAAVFEIGDLSLQALSAPALEFARASSSATDFGFGEEGDRYSAMNGSSTTEKRGTETVAKTTISDAMTFIKEQEREQKIASGEIVGTFFLFARFAFSLSLAPRDSYYHYSRVFVLVRRNECCTDGRVRSSIVLLSQQFYCAAILISDRERDLRR